MKINYVMTIDATVIFDGTFACSTLSGSYHPISTYIETAKDHMAHYGFASAAIIDSETGEILVEMESDCNDCYPDDGPAYYDDGNTCGYK